MAGQLAEAGPGTVAAQDLERFGYLSMCSRPTRGPEFVVQGMLDKRVREVVVPRYVRKFTDQCDGHGSIEDVKYIVL